MFRTVHPKVLRAREAEGEHDEALRRVIRRTPAEPRRLARRAGGRARPARSRARGGPPDDRQVGARSAPPGRRRRRATAPGRGAAAAVAVARLRSTRNAAPLRQTSATGPNGGTCMIIIPPIASRTSARGPDAGPLERDDGRDDGDHPREAADAAEDARLAEERRADDRVGRLARPAPRLAAQVVAGLREEPVGDPEDRLPHGVEHGEDRQGERARRWRRGRAGRG